MRVKIILFEGYLRAMRYALPLILLISCSSPRALTDPNAINPHAYQPVKKLLADRGVVVSAHPLASRVGLSILRKGGTAVDAAIATQWALAVVYPSAGNIGGGGFCVMRLAGGELVSIDYREKAPSRAHRDMYLGPDGSARTDKSQDGHLSSGVPGAVAGIFETHRFATLPMKDLIQPAIDLAEHGFSITENEARALNRLQPEFRKFNTVMPVFVREREWKAGDTLIQRDLAATLKRIRDQGAGEFYGGKTARLVEEEMKRGGGIITLSDLSAYRAVQRSPYVFDYRGFRVVGMGLPSSGALMLHQMMKMIEGRHIGDMGFHSPSAVQLMIEVERRAFADRSKYMGDPDFGDLPIAGITHPTYLQHRMRDFRPGQPTPSSLIHPGEPITESEETTHFNVVDDKGNVVAITTTLNNSYGSRTVIGGAGFLINDEMDDFSIKPGVPNMYGAIGGEANAIQPGKRMLSSMAPTIVLKNGKPYLVTGTPGGTTIPTSVFQTLVNILEFDLDAEAAVNSPKFHHQWYPDTTLVERDFPPDVINALRKMGYMVNYRGAIGRTELVKMRSDGRFEAIADKRGDDSAAGW